MAFFISWHRKMNAQAWARMSRACSGVMPGAGLRREAQGLFTVALPRDGRDRKPLYLAAGYLPELRLPALAGSGDE